MSTTSSCTRYWCFLGLEESLNSNSKQKNFKHMKMSHKPTVVYGWAHSKNICNTVAEHQFWLSQTFFPLLFFALLHTYEKIMTSFLPSHQSSNKVKSQTGIIYCLGIKTFLCLPQQVWRCLWHAVYLTPLLGPVFKKMKVTLSCKFHSSLHPLLTFSIPWVTKTGSLITLLAQRQVNKWWDLKTYQLGDY